MTVELKLEGDMVAHGGVIVDHKLGEMVERGLVVGELVRHFDGVVGLVTWVSDEGDVATVLIDGSASTHYILDWLTNGWWPMDV